MHAAETAQTEARPDPELSPTEASARPTDYRLTKAEVIVVDDDAAVRQRLRAMLEWAGYTVRTAASGEQAIGLLSARFCPLLLTDAVMPGMSGLELCRMLRESTFERYVYTIILSVRDESDDVLRGLSAGADDYVSKRAPKYEILARLRTGRRIVAMADTLREIAATARKGTYHDPLTLTFNRRYLVEGLRREIDRARRYRHSLSLLACEVSGAAPPGESPGLGVSDEMLQEFVGRLRGVLRDGCDWIARAEGGKFFVVLPETSIEGACRVAEKVLRYFANTPLGATADGTPTNVNVGVTGSGSATLRRFSACEHLLEFADRCLKRSRFMGAGQYCAAAFDPRELRADESSKLATNIRSYTQAEGPGELVGEPP
ncbi:MAG: GGDEF domain-containing response regulator [Steroidobacterales bacterium]